MALIKELEQSLINKIAAGEVVERPASVVKELVENSIDSGADSIIVKIKDAGKSLIEVSDNGSGMDKDDLLMSFKAHTTSKISNVDDLFRISTLGFRGEALSSIASVSMIEISSCEKGSDKGNKVIVEGGNLISEKVVGMPSGTTVAVKDLFFNTPARKKHLKNDKTELSHIHDVLQRISFSTNIGIKFISNDSEILNVPRGISLLDRIVTLYGKNNAKNMFSVEYKDEFLQMQGFLGKPYLARKDKSMQTIFFNNRFVKNKVVSEALYDAYHTLLFLDRNPCCVLFIEIDPSKTDVNVHPQKEIIRVEKEDQLYKSIFEAVKNALKENNLVPDADLDSGSMRITKQSYGVEKDKQQLLAVAEDDKDGFFSRSQKKIPVINKNDNTGDEKGRIGPVRIIGQFNRMYLLAESAEGLLIIDQHAAQERIFFERFMLQYSEKAVVQQNLIKPRVKELSSSDSSLVLDNLDMLNKMGFDIEEYGNNSFRINKIPQVFGRYDDTLFNDIISELKTKPSSINEKIEDRIARMACRKAIKAGDILTEPEMKELINELGKCEKPFACPHGRPTIINFSLADLEKKFKRAG